MLNLVAHSEVLPYDPVSLYERTETYSYRILTWGRGGDRRGSNVRSPRPRKAESGLEVPAIEGKGSAVEAPPCSQASSCILYSRWLFLAFKKLLAMLQRPNILEHVLSLIHI